MVVVIFVVVVVVVVVVVRMEEPQTLDRVASCGRWQTSTWAGCGWCLVRG